MQQNLEVLYRTKDVILQTNAPLVVQNADLLRDRYYNQLLACCSLQVLAPRPITAVEVQINCWDSFDNPCGSVKQSFIDLHAAEGMVIGANVMTPLPNQNTRRISAYVTMVRYADGAIEQFSEDGVVLPAAVALAEHFKDAPHLNQQYVRDTVSAAVCVPARAEGYWWCTCGKLNQETVSWCPVCGSQLEKLEEALDVDRLTKNLENYRAELQAEAQKRELAAAQERQRMMEQAAEAERQRQEKKKARNKKDAIICAIAAALVVVGIVAGSLISKETRYQKAIELLEQYHNKEAMEVFEELGDYKESEEYLKEAKYQYAKDLRVYGQIDDALALLEEIPGYKDSDDLAVDWKFEGKWYWIYPATINPYDEFIFDMEEGTITWHFKSSLTEFEYVYTFEFVDENTIKSTGLREREGKYSEITITYVGDGMLQVEYSDKSVQPCTNEENLYLVR